MVESAYPFDTGPGANVLEAEWQRMAREWLATGVIAEFREELLVTANGAAMQVTAQTGAAWVEGFWYDTDADVVLPIGAADASNPRLDLVVVRLDRTANTASLAVLQGAPAADPVAVALTQTDGLYELPLAQVRVNAAVGVISAGDVTDRRAFTRNLGLADMAAEVARANAAYEPIQLIATSTPPAGNAVTFSSIPQTFRHLVVIGTGLRSVSALDLVFARLNGDTGANYRRLRHEVTGAGVASTSFDDAGTSLLIGRWGGAGGTFSVELPDYSGSSFKHAQFSSWGRASSAAADNVTTHGGGQWANVAPITSLLFSIGNGFGANSRFSLYGRK